MATQTKQILKMQGAKGSSSIIKIIKNPSLNYLYNCMCHFDYNTSIITYVIDHLFVNHSSNLLISNCNCT